MNKFIKFVWQLIPQMLVPQLIHLMYPCYTPEQKQLISFVKMQRYYNDYNTLQQQ